MPQTNEFKWSATKYSIREFVDVFSHRLPLVVQVVDGSVGDESLGAQASVLTSDQSLNRSKTKCYTGIGMVRIVWGYAGV